MEALLGGASRGDDALTRTAQLNVHGARSYSAEAAVCSRPGCAGCRNGGGGRSMAPARGASADDPDDPLRGLLGEWPAFGSEPGKRR
jgi:hypothetical protein